MSEFKWHKPEDELPEFGEGDYLLMGKRGADASCMRTRPAAPTATQR